MEYSIDTYSVKFRSASAENSESARKIRLHYETKRFPRRVCKPARRI